MNYHCEIKDQPAQPTLSIRARTPVEELPALLGESYGKIATYLAELGESPTGAPFAAYYNMDMQDLDVEVGFPVAKPLAGKNEIQASQVPGGQLASILHVGPYSDIAPAYEALAEYVKEQGREPTGISYEFYLNDPQKTPPAELHTQVLFPLQ
jgi:effector-binding domain-containing protein